MIVFDEKKHAEKMLKIGFITPNQEIRDLFILAKYLYNNNYIEEEVIKYLINFLEKNNIGYSSNLIESIVLKTAKSAKQGILVYDKVINIYESELKEIQKLNDEELEKLLFCYITLSKFYNGMFKISRAELFRLAGLKVYNDKKPKLINKLNKLGLTLTKSVKGKTLRGVNIKPKGDCLLSFIASDEFIVEFLKYKYPNKYKKCICCQKTIEIKNNKTQYCKECAREIEKSNWAERKRRQRNKVNVTK